jgi:tRNA dimethylallyltransferase
MENKPQILIITGPTATGKTDLAVRLAKKFKGEIISADSRQVYSGLDVGTGKITKKEMKGIPHYLIDIADPKKKFTVVQYVEQAEKAIQEILSKKKVPIVVGGTGFYIEALVDGIILPDVPPDNSLRKKLEKKTPAQLFAMLQKLDPKRAKAMDPLNSRRLIRAIEIARTLGKVPKIKKSKPKYDPLYIGLYVDPEKLKEKICKRLKKRLGEGMIKEAISLHKKGLSWKRMYELGLEYRYLALYLQKRMTREEMAETLEKEIWQYARRQMTWFRRNGNIHWYSPKDVGSIAGKVEKFMK